MSLAKLAFDRVPRPQLRELVDAGTLSPLVLVRPFSPLDAYPEALTAIPLPDVPVLRERRKSTGPPNLHHLAYVGISRTYLADVRKFLTLAPGRYGRNVAVALAIYSTPASANTCTIFCSVWRTCPTRSSVSNWHWPFQPICPPTNTNRPRAAMPLA